MGPCLDARPIRPAASLMPNSLLFVIAVATTCAAIWAIVVRTSAAAPAVAMSVVMLIASLGGPVWEWAKYVGGAGLPADIDAAPFADSLAVKAFLWACIGSGVSAFLVPRMPDSLRELKEDTNPSERITVITLVAVVVSFVLFVIGSGPSFFSRQYYLESDGNLFLLRAAFPVGLVLGLVALGQSTIERRRRWRIAIYVMSTVWFIGLAGVGSRTALAFPLLGAVLIINRCFKERQLRPMALTVASGLIALAIFTFGVVLKARYVPHGLINLPSVAAAFVQDAVASTDSLLVPMKQLLASIFTSYPLAEHSVIYDVGLPVLIGNANILPGTGLPMELERYWPYDWVPLSFAGSWFGATGAAGQMALFMLFSWVCCYCSYNLQRSRFQSVVFVPLALSLLISVLSMEYSSRMVWRVFSVALFALFASFLLRNRVESSSPDVSNLSGHAGADVMAGLR